MYILVINSGSSSIKYQLFPFHSEEPLSKGLIERIGLPGSFLTHTFTRQGVEQTLRLDEPVADHAAGMRQVAALLVRADIAVLQDPAQISCIGHRVVHGGETLSRTTVITPGVKQKIKDLYPLAPLHNPGHIKGIEVTEAIFPGALQVAVFDTAFHQTLPERAFRYAIPERFYKQEGVRVYGFHGISHEYVAGEALAYLGRPGARLVTIHLGNGCSMAAVQGGTCIDTSMGMTPLDGLIMGTRSGTIDASVLIHLSERLGLTPAELSVLLNKESGMLGLTGHSDMRDVSRLYAAGDPAAVLAYEMYAYRIKKFIGAYAAALNGLDAIVFTAGVGENDALTRELVCRDMDVFGIAIDGNENTRRDAGIRNLSAAGARTPVLVIPTNEELAIARKCRKLAEESA
ncbi:acetate kinase [Pedobacter yulinensis]|uniref:Acetate kinase n=1 Tax=Pedobacter yulinensis TaxID=2126353 RepID=A0A2T3HJZ6_9SPHI|nr:acetate kinase [Pedobacter yulinensis]PST82756.1 acetate kinase [Pedobacter yulinensis]